MSGASVSYHRLFAPLKGTNAHYPAEVMVIYAGGVERGRPCSLPGLRQGHGPATDLGLRVGAHLRGG